MAEFVIDRVTHRKIYDNNGELICKFTEYPDIENNARFNLCEYCNDVKCEFRNLEAVK